MQHRMRIDLNAAGVLPATSQGMMDSGRAVVGPGPGSGAPGDEVLALIKQHAHIARRLQMLVPAAVDGAPGSPASRPRPQSLGRSKARQRLSGSLPTRSMQRPATTSPLASHSLFSESALPGPQSPLRGADFLGGDYTLDWNKPQQLLRSSSSKDGTAGGKRSPIRYVGARKESDGQRSALPTTTEAGSWSVETDQMVGTHQPRMATNFQRVQSVASTTARRKATSILGSGSNGPGLSPSPNPHGVLKERLYDSFDSSGSRIALTERRWCDPDPQPGRAWRAASQARLPMEGLESDDDQALRGCGPTSFSGSALAPAFVRQPCHEQQRPTSLLVPGYFPLY